MWRFLIFMGFFMMKKTAIALGIAALACGAQAAEVFKNADTAVSVNFDLQPYMMNLQESATATSRTYLLSDAQVQFKGSKTISDDLTVFTQIELDGDPIGDNATLNTDDVRFGLASKTWGSIQVGQFDSFMEDELMEITNSFAIAKRDLITEPTAGNDGRHILWNHKIGDFRVGVDYTMSANAASSATDGNSGLAYTVAYAVGDLKLVAGTSTITTYKADTYANNTFETAQGLGARYTLTSGAGVTQLNALSATNTIYSATPAYDGGQVTYSSFSVVHTMGAWNVGVITSSRNYPATSSTVAAFGAQENAVQAVYDLGKGAKVYAAVANYGLSTSVGNFTEVGFQMSF